MWQVWLLIVIILLITIHRHPSFFSFCYFFSACLTCLLALLISNLLLETFFFFSCSIIFSTLCHHFTLRYISRHLSLISSSDLLLAKRGIVIHPISSSPFNLGLVKIKNEIWLAHSETPLTNGTVVKPIAIQGIRLLVMPISTSNQLKKMT